MGSRLMLDLSLIIGASKAKNCQEFDFEVRFPVLSPKLAKKANTQMQKAKKLVEEKIVAEKLTEQETSETRFRKISR